MWSTQTLWFDTAVVMSIFALGNILFGHFEEHKPKVLRLMKVALFLGVTLTLSYFGMRWLAYCLIGLKAPALSPPPIYLAIIYPVSTR